jgi:hypothetical protein
MSSSRSRYDVAAAQTALSKYVSDYEVAESLYETPNPAKYHELDATYANFSLSELKWFMSMDKNVKPSKEFKKLYGDMVIALADLYLVLGDEQLMKDMPATSITSNLAKWKEFKEAAAEFRPPTKVDVVHDDRTGEGDEDSESDGEYFVPVSKKGKDPVKKAEKRKRQAEKRKVLHPDPEAVSEPSVEHTVVNINGEASFKTGKRVVSLAYIPGFSARFLGSKRVSRKELESLSEKEKGQIEWKRVSDESYVDLRSLNRGVIAKARADGLLPSDTASSLLRKGNNNAVDVKVFTADQAILEGLSEHDLQVSQAVYWKAQAEVALNTAGLSNKVPITFAWFDNLLDIPESIAIGNVAKTFAKWMQRSCRSDNPRSEVNNTLYSIKLAMFAVWPPGSTRDDMLKRSEKSRRAAFGKDYDKALEAFLATPAGQQVVRPKMPKVSSFQAAANKAAKVVVDKAREIAQGVNDTIEATAAETHAMTWRDTAGMYWDRWFARLKGIERPVMPRMPQIKGNWFTDVFRKSVAETDVETGLVEAKRVDRQWWRSTLGVFTAPVYAVSRFIYGRDKVVLAKESNMHKAAAGQVGFLVGWGTVAHFTGLLASPLVGLHVAVGVIGCLLINAVSYKD